jgi:hypothetical protein
MLLFRRNAFLLALTLTCALFAGCANPGPPRPPSLHLPEPVHDLSAKRVGDVVELRFTAPWRSTDKLPLRGTMETGAMCRDVEHQGCVTVGPKMDAAIAGPNDGHNVVLWHDPLPAELTTGKPQLVGYRVEFFNTAGKSAGKSDAAYAIAGEAPQRVTGLRAEGSRLGIVLRWNAVANAQGEVVVKREDLSPKTKPAKNDTVLLAAHASGEVSSTLDTSARPDVPYRYTAVRQLHVTLGGRTLTMQSEESAPVSFTLQQTYPPPTPTGLTAEAYSKDAEYAVDLIWQPVDETRLVTKLAGYNVYRTADGTKTKLNATPVSVPAFHDGSAKSSTAYTYSVTAVDTQGNESGAATVVLNPSVQ